MEIRNRLDRNLNTQPLDLIIVSAIRINARCRKLGARLDCHLYGSLQEVISTFSFDREM